GMPARPAGLRWREPTLRPPRPGAGTGRAPAPLAPPRVGPAGHARRQCPPPPAAPSQATQRFSKMAAGMPNASVVVTPAANASFTLSSLWLPHALFSPSPSVF
ncbi:unnamed protein product, partial [Bubo scandiacus]